MAGQTDGPVKSGVLSRTELLFTVFVFFVITLEMHSECVHGRWVSKKLPNTVMQLFGS